MAVLLVCTPVIFLAQTAGVSTNDAYLIRGMLRDSYETVKTHYYDPAFHGLDWDARYREYSDRLKSAASVDAGEVIVAQFLDGLKDSHTYFSPPSRSFTVDYGYRLALVGDETLVAQVHAGTDAAAKLAPGDRVISINGLPVDRESFHTVHYILDILAPRTSTELSIHRQSGDERQVTVASTVTQQRIARNLSNGNEISALQQQQADALQWTRSVTVERGGVLLWRLPIFLAENSEIDHLFDLARRHTGLVLDLRGNSGGRIDTLSRIVANLFDHGVRIATRTARTDRLEIRAATRGADAYSGKLVVLVDSGSASASELLARVIQLERRGTVLGDRSAGAVMEALVYPFRLGNDLLKYYALSVTDADLVMEDGRSLERVGVAPDEIVLPTPADLATDRDPALSRAAHLAGVEIDPVAAGRIFPREWTPR